MMNSHFWKMGTAACFALSLGSAHATQTLSFTASVSNDTEHDISLIAASWSLGGKSPEDYKIPAESDGSFGLTLTNVTKDQVVFRYSSGNQTCKFSAGHGVKESFGWFTSTKTPHQWADAKSEGSFMATCTATVVSHTPGRGYSVQFGMK